MELRTWMRVISVSAAALIALPALAGLMDEAQLTAQDAIIADFHSDNRDLLDVTGCDLTGPTLPGADVAVTCYAEGQVKGTEDQYDTHSCVVNMKRVERAFEALSVNCAVVLGE